LVAQAVQLGAQLFLDGVAPVKLGLQSGQLLGQVPNPEGYNDGNN
jgi:hypothetical protein